MSQRVAAEMDLDPGEGPLLAAFGEVARDEPDGGGWCCWYRAGTGRGVLIGGRAFEGGNRCGGSEVGSFTVDCEGEMDGCGGG